MGIGAPLALWCAWGIARRRVDAGFWMTVLAVGELYGGELIFLSYVFHRRA